MSFTGADNNIQRKVRRAVQYLQEKNSSVFAQFSGSHLPDMLKAIFIALDEDYSELNTIAGTPTGVIDVDITTVSSLPPAPFDSEG